MADTKIATSPYLFSRKMAAFSVALYSITPPTSPKYGRQFVSSKPCSHLRRQKRVFHSTFCPRMSSAVEIQISMMKRLPQLQPAAVTMKRKIRRKSVLLIRKRADQLTKLKALPIVGTPTKTKAPTDPGRNNPLLFHSFNPNSETFLEREGASAGAMKRGGSRWCNASFLPILS